MLTENKYIRFDWAVKRMLRDKANFAVLEGLVTRPNRRPIRPTVQSQYHEGSSDYFT